MKALKIVLVVILTLVVVQLALTGINIWQKGGPYKGQTMEQILGVDPAKATDKDIGKLDKAAIFQLFYAAPAPKFEDVKGEYNAKTLPVGILAMSADYFTHNFFGPGRWVGKAFAIAEKDKGWGYNMFSTKGKDGSEVIARTRKMNTYLGKSLIDGKESFHLDYSPYNSGAVHSMHDELRRINDHIMIGMGYMGLGGGSINPAPFLVIGPSAPWVGPDKE
ncbi:MAG: hypothetical protein CVU61_16290 [Deltaproteobacteria bacterium HGW-Deltaproteobacteria-19]|nr:MAG: hypothetical protein CVU61_16290 [Deltaproteobacteria bacterium HGW-Deltaproteobacteria-19]